jgi:hypothetical protein
MRQNSSLFERQQSDIISLIGAANEVHQLVILFVELVLSACIRREGSKSLFAKKSPLVFP